jgi:hypothetical protein
MCRCWLMGFGVNKPGTGSWVGACSRPVVVWGMVMFQRECKRGLNARGGVHYLFLVVAAKHLCEVKTSSCDALDGVLT